MHEELFTRDAEARDYIAQVDDAAVRVALTLMVSVAASSLARDERYVSEIDSRGRLDMLTFIKAVHASLKLGDTLRDVLDGKIQSLDETAYAW